MVKIKTLRFGQSVFIGDKETNFIRASAAPHIQMYYDEDHMRFIIVNSKARLTSEIWVYPTNVQYAEPMEKTKVLDASDKEPSKVSRARA